MKELDTLYVRLLIHGLSILKEAIRSDDAEWTLAEIEWLHNVPSLIGEDNKERHRYFWYKERRAYIDWVSDLGRERARLRMSAFYEPIWNEMEPLLSQFLKQESEPPTPTC